MSWTDAEAWCKAKSQKMMLIVNQEENNYLKNHLPKQYYWIGLRKTEGIWKWHGAEKNLTGNGFWASGEPNSRTKDEDCVEIYINNNQNNGKWNDERCFKMKSALCYNASCFNNSCGNNATCVETIGSYTCKCNPGFTGPKCTEVQCPPLAIINGRMDCSHHRHTNGYISTCSFSCEEGFELSGSHKTLCNHTGQWTHSTPNCTAILCKAIHVPHGGVVSCHRGNSTICTVQCPSDYLLLGVHEYTCRPDGSWSPFQPLCARVQAWTYHYSKDKMEWNMARQWCKTHHTDLVAIQNQEEVRYLNQELPKISSYYWIGLRKTGDKWTWVDSMKPLTAEAASWATGEPNDQGTNEDCVEIYIKRDKDSGKWNDDKCSKAKAALCYKAVDCGMVTNPEQGFVECRHVNGDFRFNSSCHFHCARGYKLQGSKDLHCLSTGKWDSKPPKCHVIECPPITTRTSGWNITCLHPLHTNSYNSTCVFSCEEGFKLRGSHTTLCDHTGQWIHNTPNCTAVTCDQLLTPGNADMSCTDPHGKFSFRSSCKVTCEEGYTLRGENTLTCLKNGSWSAETPTCEVVKCSDLNSAPYGSMRCTDPLEKYAYSSICRFKCDVGFLLTGSNYTLCNSQGKWTHSLPVCQAVKCGPLSIQSTDVRRNCTHPLSTNSYNSTCVFYCDEGFKLIGSNKTQCDNRGEWTPKNPTCQAVTCDQLLTSGNAHMKCADPHGNFSFRSSCNVTCEEGYTLRGENTLTCLKNGSWSAETPTCEVVKCSDLNSAPYGSMRCTDPLEKYAYGSICWFKCDVGFLLTGSNYTLCNSQGKWTHSLPVCQAVTCDWLVTPKKSHMSCTDPHGKFSFRSSCNVTCEEGYTLREENTLTCLKNGSWSAETPTCEVVTCDQLATPGNADMSCTDPHGKFSFRSSCKVTCEEGYTLRGENTLTCLKNGSWSAETPTCEVVKCSDLTSAPYGSMRCTDPLEKYAYGSICWFKCDVGFLLTGSNYTLCNSQGKWTHSLPVCQAVTCDQLVTPGNAHMKCSDPHGKFSFRSSCNVTCKEGYTLRGENMLTCLKTGSWSAETPTCEARQCPLLSSPKNGWMNCSYPHSLFSYGSHCRFKCEIGHVLRGESNLSCTAAGTWSQTVPSCEVVQCESILLTPLQQSDSTPVPLMNCSHPRGNFSFGSQCVFSCPEGYRLNSTTDLICSATGLWTDLLPICIIKDMSLGNALLVYSAIGAAASLGLLLIGGFVMLLVWKYSQGKLAQDTPLWNGTLNPVFEEN
ncbi:P-selectin [Silurus asotus]|uniref:E-selectin n=1 Tax=Silurus asotus TaxID=30991 RepID=A0AAD5B5F7_SILAS|nr:P-selectin [Silurus asotus]